MVWVVSKVWDSGVKIEGLGFRVEGVGLRVQCRECKI